MNLCAISSKGAITVSMLLNHQAGLAALRQPVPPGAFWDWDLMVSMLEKAEPWWRPGSMHGYHGLTFGWLVGEVVRRVSGKSLGSFFREEVAEPLDLASLQAVLMFNTGGHMFPGPDGVFGFNLRAARAAEIGAAGGITNARGLAGMYAPLAN